MPEGAVEGIDVRLARVRQERGLSLRQFAHEMGRRGGYAVSHDSVRQYENGRSVPADYVKALCRAWDLRADWLLFGAGEPSGPPGRLAEETLDEMSDLEGRCPHDDLRGLVARTRAQWERFTEGLEPDHPLRPPVLESWRRCRDAGVEARDGKPVRRPPDEVGQRVREARPFLDAARPHLQWVHAVLADLPHVAYLTDADGVVLHALATSEELLDEWCLRPGFDWSETAAGSNGAGTALATGRVVAVIGSEHYAEPFHESVCMAAPVRAPGGDVVGALDVSTPLEDGIPRHLTIVACAVGMIEEALAGR